MVMYFQCLIRRYFDAYVDTTATHNHGYILKAKLSDKKYSRGMYSEVLISTCLSSPEGYWALNIYVGEMG